MLGRIGPEPGKLKDEKDRGKDLDGQGCRPDPGAQTAKVQPAGHSAEWRFESLSMIDRPAAAVPQRILPSSMNASGSAIQGCEKPLFDCRFIHRFPWIRY